MSIMDVQAIYHPKGSKKTVSNTPAVDKGSGSFWLSRRTIQILLENRATAIQIGICLVIARYTDAGGRFSSAGMKAIKNALGIGDAMAEHAIPALQKILPYDPQQNALIYTPDNWANIRNELIPERPTERSRIRWVVNDYGEAPKTAVWFGNELIDGYGRFQQPLRRLKQCGDTAARLLLKLYEQNDMEQWGGIKPYPNFYQKYIVEKKGSLCGSDLWHAIRDQDSAWQSLATPVIGRVLRKKEELADDDWKIFWNALSALKLSGFIYSTIAVLDRDVTDPDAQPLYLLGTKNLHGNIPKGEEGLGGDTARAAGKLGHPVTDKNGRFNGRYAVIVPEWVTPTVAGVYRLRFRVTNPLNRGVKSAWARIFQNQEEAGGWIRTMLQRWEQAQTPPQ